MERFDIVFKGLKAGKHKFDFSLDDRFWEQSDGVECKGGSVRIAAELEKKENLLTFEFFYSGSLKLICDRCLEVFDMPVEYESTLHVRFDEQTGREDPDVMFIDPNDHKINLADYFIESIRLFLPLKRIHPVNEGGNPMCDKEMLEKLEQYRVRENKEITDPRWDSLRDIIDGG